MTLSLNQHDILELLVAPTAQTLLAQADGVRRDAFGASVHLRAIVEISNHCRAQCRYCGLRQGMQSLRRYRLASADIVLTAKSAVAAGFDTVVIQSGEDPLLKNDAFVTTLHECAVAVDAPLTLSLGEWPVDLYQRWQQAGAARYLLKFETSNPHLYAYLRPQRKLQQRLSCIDALRCTGYQLGSGFMVGLPGQTIADLANDLILTKSLDLDMIAIGPFIPHPRTPLAYPQQQAHNGIGGDTPTAALDVVDLTLRCVAIARILSPNAHIPATTALGTLHQEGRCRGLSSGANVLMQDVTPAQYRQYYDIYPRRRDVEPCMQAQWHQLQAQLMQWGRCVSRD